MSPADFDVSDIRQSWVFDLPVDIPSGNELRRKYRNPHVYARLRGEFEWALFAVKYVSTIPKATGPRKVTLTRLIPKGGRVYDNDNLVTGAKPAIDSMVKAGLLLGDAPHQVTVEYQQDRCSLGGGGTRVAIEEL